VARRYPASVAIDKAGNLVIADPFNHRIFRVGGIAAPGLLAGQPFP
jgi:NHL repeat